MDLGVTGARLASSVVMPVVKQLFRLEGAGAGLVEKPVRISALVSFTGERRTLSEGNLRKLVHALVRHADRNARPTGDGTAGEMNGTGSGSHVEPEAVTDALVHTLHALGDLTMEDVEAVRLGHNKLARVLYETGGGSRITRSLSADSTQLYGLVLESACLHILHFFTQRSTFIARTLVEQSRDLSDLIVRTDLLLERVPDRASKDAEFEQRYAEYVAKKHSSITIYGIDLNESREWPLDTAYLNLEAVTVGESFASHSHGSHIEEYGAYEWRQTPAQHVDSLLTSHKRVLLRGAAGSGKTTLIQWLAVSTALQERLSGHLVRLAGLVPFVLPLRTLTRRSASLPTPQDFLTSMGCPLSGSQPAGWADRVLGAGRGLLLVDGIDEVPERERERVRRWLCDLTAAFPGSRLVVTSRPSAVREYWLANEEFAEVSLSPMSPEDVALFINRWHAAAKADPELEAALLEAVRVNPDLARLATNPLMSGLICALHRERRGFLPRGRKALYDAALSMLLERRDRERDMESQGGLELDEESQSALLQKLAYWLIRNERVEMEHADAHEVLRRVLPMMPHVAAQGSAEDIFHFLLVRSGLMREPGPGTVDFLHRTFQDYLGAREAVEERDFGLLVAHAHLDQWEDVLRMAVAQSRADERSLILGKLVERGDAEPDVRARLHLLATACLEHATKLDPRVRADVEHRTAALLPPRSIAEAELLASLGPVTLELLSGLEGLEDDEAHAVVLTATIIGGDAALALLHRYIDHPNSAVTGRLAGQWDRFDTSAYGAQIIRPLVKSEVDVWVTVSTHEQLSCLHDMGGHHRIRLIGSFSPESILTLLNREKLVALDLWDNDQVEDLRFLTHFSRLESLTVHNCSGDVNLSPLVALPLNTLNLRSTQGESAVRGLSELTRLRSLFYLSDSKQWHGLSSIPRGLTRLSLPASVRDLEGLRDFVDLKDLSIHFVTDPITDSTWQSIATLSGLTYLCLKQSQLLDIADSQQKFPQVKCLQVFCWDGPDAWSGGLDLPTSEIADAFPDISELSVSRPGMATDLTPLAGLHSLRKLTLFEPKQSAENMNSEVLAPTVELEITPRPRENNQNDLR